MVQSNEWRQHGIRLYMINEGGVCLYTVKRKLTRLWSPQLHLSVSHMVFNERAHKCSLIIWSY